VNDIFIFVYGLVASVFVAVGFAALLWAGVEDGRAQKESDALAKAKAAGSGSSGDVIDN
jgi:hypothetical protein